MNVVAALRKLWLGSTKRDGTGLNVRMPPLSPEPPKLSRMQKAIIVVLTVYAVLAIAPDTLRPFPDSRLTRIVRAMCTQKLFGHDCYPLGTLGFHTNNDGKIEDVEMNSPLAGKNGKPSMEGKLINLESVQPDRRIINMFEFAAPDSSYSFSVQDNPHQIIPVTATPKTFTDQETFALEIAQISGITFLLVCVFLVWRHPMVPTWGLFFYSLWFNSGQYFVWYANLPERPWLIIFNFIQAGLQALGLTGFLAFALYFPYNNLKGWRHAARSYVPYLYGIVFGMLFVFNSWGFMNLVQPWRTETPFEIYYALTYLVYAMATLLLWDTYRTQPQARAKVRWIAIFGSWGLINWLLADTYETTSMLNWFTDLLSRRTMPWLLSHGWTPEAIYNLMYAQTVMLPLVFLYTTLYHRVMGVRFLASRTAIVVIPFIVSIALIEYFVESLNLPGQLVLAVGITATVHNRLHGFVERWLCPQWHREKDRMKKLVGVLREGEDLDLTQVNKMLVEGMCQALGLKSAALFHRRNDNESFTLEKVFQWPELEKELRADHAFIGRDGSPIQLHSLTSEPVRLRVPDDEDDCNASRDSRIAVLAAPIFIRCQVSRVVLIDRDEDFDPDEFSVIRDVSLAASMTYKYLDLEAASRPERAVHPH